MATVLPPTLHVQAIPVGRKYSYFPMFEDCISSTRNWHCAWPRPVSRHSQLTTLVARLASAHATNRLISGHMCSRYSSRHSLPMSRLPSPTCVQVTGPISRHLRLAFVWAALSHSSPVRMTFHLLA